jgi:RimJ/RimL family protein N-acetyltransferase
MLDTAKYSAPELLRDGRRVEIRALRPDDRADFVAAVSQTTLQSLYRRFFVPRRSFTAQEIAAFVDIDFVDCVALIAVMRQGERPVIAGGGRYVVGRGQAELAFMVVDRYQGRGIASALMRHLETIARETGISELTADVLAENAAMLGVFKKSGFRVTSRAAGIVHVTLQLC